MSQTTPLTKLILTTEGWLVVAFNAVIAIAAIFGTLPGTQALKWAGVVNAATVIARSGLKAIAALSPVVGAPIPPDPADPVLVMLEEIEQAQAQFQAKPGTLADQVTVGLSPTAPSPTAPPVAA